MDKKADERRMTRRDFVGLVSKGAGLFLFGGLIGRLLHRSRGKGLVWQIDPSKCIQCGRCATACVLQPSAVKCMNDFSLCGYCRICFGFNTTDAAAIDEAAENQICPVGAIRRKFVEGPYYEYTIDRALCIGCARCVRLCKSFGNGSFYLQIQRDLCVNCNECAIASGCPAKAITRIPVEQAYYRIS